MTRITLALTSAIRQYDGNRWESRWYEVYNEVLICAWDVRADLTIAPQFELHKMLADGNGVMNVVKRVTPDFTVFRYDHSIREGKLLVKEKCPILVCEGKKGDRTDMSALDEQCIEQVSYAFESRDSDGVVHILKWVGTKWWTHSVKRSESRRLSNNVDATYLDKKAGRHGTSGSGSALKLRVISSGEVSVSHESINELVNAIRRLRI